AGFLDHFIDLFGGHRLLGVDDEVDDTDVRGRYANGESVQFALEVRQYQTDSLGSSGGGGDHRLSSGSGATKIFVGSVERLLVQGVAVDGGHHTMLDAELVIDCFGYRSQAVGGAACVGDDVVLLGIVFFVVDAE